MKRLLKRFFLGLLLLVCVLAGGAGIYAAVQASRFDASADNVYDVALPAVARSNDLAVIARGKHLAESVAPCASSDCHGIDLGGGKTIQIGPVGTFTGPNLTSAGLGAAYSDAELARAISHGLKKDGRSVRFMPSQDFSWLPDSDVVAIVSYLRTVPAVERPNGITLVKTLGKVLDRRDQFVLDVARRIDHSTPERPPPPAPTAAYGKFIARLCSGCHGAGLSGGPIPGAPPSMPVPPNLTPHQTGLAGWSYEDFERALVLGVRKNGEKLNPFMPFAAFGKLDENEKRALWAYLQTVSPTELGKR